MVTVRDDLPITNKGTIDFEQWIDNVSAHFTIADKALLRIAGTLSLQAGGNVLTPENESCFRQGLQSAEVLLGLQPDIDSLVAAILYESVRYGNLEISTISDAISPQVAHLIEGLIKIDTTKAKRSAKESSKTSSFQIHTRDNLRRMLLSVVEDVRVVLIKLASYVSALRSAKNAEDERRIQLSNDAREIYGPLANRLGLGKLKWELEDLTFRYLEPNAYSQIAKSLAQKRRDREAYIDNIIVQLSHELQKEGIQAEISGRVKHIYSIWRKMIRKDLDFKEIYDIRAVRILVPKISDCYAALGVVHSLWQHIPKEFDDYIATPKDNGYRSLHTAVFGPEGRTLEIQIRTFDMHQEAEKGVAAHWAYKEGVKQVNSKAQILSLQKVLAESEFISDQAESESTLREEILEDKIYVFSPAGDVVDLPNGSTPIDFAYYVHTELGHRCRGAKVNGKMVNLTYQLKSGDQVEILSIKEGGPSRDWLNSNLGYIHSHRAKVKAQSWFRRQDREQNIESAKEMIDKERRRLGLGDKFNLHKVAAQLNFDSTDDMFLAIGVGDLKLSQVIQVIQGEDTEEKPKSIIIKAPKSQQVENHDVYIAGVGNLVCHFAKCCKPLPGEPIIGYITLGRGVSIHRQDCVNVLRPEEENRLIEVNWGKETASVYPVDITITAYDRQNLLRDITAILSHERINVIGVNSTVSKVDNLAVVTFTLEITDLQSLASLMNKISQLPNVLETKRVFQ